MNEFIRDHPMKFTLVVLGLMACLMILNYGSNYVSDTIYETVIHEDVITNKWTVGESAFLIFGHKTIYKIEVGNDFVVEVSDVEYHNYNLGDTYTWETSEMKQKYKDVLIVEEGQ